jgi:hypothetical protein
MAAGAKARKSLAHFCSLLLLNIQQLLQFRFRTWTGEENPAGAVFEVRALRVGNIQAIAAWNERAIRIRTARNINRHVGGGQFLKCLLVVMALVSTCAPRFFTVNSMAGNGLVAFGQRDAAKLVRLFGVIGDVGIAGFNRLGDHADFLRAFPAIGRQ